MGLGLGVGLSLGLAFALALPFAFLFGFGCFLFQLILVLGGFVFHSIFSNGFYINSGPEPKEAPGLGPFDQQMHGLMSFSHILESWVIKQQKHFLVILTSQSSLT